MDTLQQDFFEATASRQGFRSDHGPCGSNPSRLDSHHYFRLAHNRRSKDSGVVLTGSQIPRYTPTHSGQSLGPVARPQVSPADVYRIIERRGFRAMKNIVLVHGGFVDGAGWEGVYKILKRDGYSVSIVQNPTISLEDDVAVTKRIL
jgi:hypothetical protein